MITSIKISLFITIFLFYLLIVICGDLGMEVALMALGVGLIIASFEIHFRYLETAKAYYNKQLDAISVELENFLKQKKPSEKDQSQLRTFSNGLIMALLIFTIFPGVFIFRGLRSLRKITQIV